MTLSSTYRWDQSRFDAALRQKLEACKTEKVPAAINKTGFFVSLKAMKETPKKTPFEIEAAVSKTMPVVNNRGENVEIPILWVIAAKSVGKTWPEQRMKLGEKRKRAVNVLMAYRAALRKKAKTILGSRKRAAAFLASGWLGVIKTLGMKVRGVSAPQSIFQYKTLVKTRGVTKGKATPAVAGLTPTCTIENSAQAKSDKKNGLVRFGGPALQRAMDSEAQSIIDHLNEETKTVLNGKID